MTPPAAIHKLVRGICLIQPNMKKNDDDNDHDNDDDDDDDDHDDGDADDDAADADDADPDDADDENAPRLYSSTDSRGLATFYWKTL